ncbi:MAG: MFS transporter, partial [Pseudomonadota bacterium]
MLSILANRAFRHLFLAQISALTGTGLLTVALGLLAYDFAGEDGALVLGLIFTVKMVAYVTLAPVAAAFANRVPRRAFLASLDIVRALTVVVFPFVSEVWQVFVLVFLLQAASAAFTPTFQATIPDVLPDEGDYTRGLSLSRLAYDLESISSPLLAFLILLTLPYEALFVIAVLGFLVSAAFVLTTRLSTPVSSDTQGVWDRTTRGVRIFLKTARLRGLLCLDLAV